MASGSDLSRIFPLLVERHTDQSGYTDWYAVTEDLQWDELTTIRGHQWRWRNAETWWLRNRGRILAASAASEHIEETAEANPVGRVHEGLKAVEEAVAGGWGEGGRLEQPVQLSLSFQ